MSMQDQVKKVLILTCIRRGTASRCLPALLKVIPANSLLVLVARGSGTSRIRLWKRKLLKICKIGILGALNGIRMRKWYDNPAEDIVDMCARLSVSCEEIDGLNSRKMENRIREFAPDIGLSLGNGYISSRIFSIPRLGMINLHSEILPAYQNAQSIIWPIYNNDPHTGYTIHEVAKKIDAGRILLQRCFSIDFCNDLESTVRKNKQKVDEKYPGDVAYVVEHIEQMKCSALEQGGGGRYTTPSYWQYLRMVWNNRKFYRLAQESL